MSNKDKTIVTVIFSVLFLLLVVPSAYVLIRGYVPPCDAGFEWVEPRTTFSTEYCVKRFLATDSCGFGSAEEARTMGGDRLVYSQENMGTSEGYCKSLKHQ